MISSVVARDGGGLESALNAQVQVMILAREFVSLKQLVEAR